MFLSVKRIFNFLSLSMILALDVPSVYSQCRGNLIFSDEFNGSSLDATKWAYETGNGCQISSDMCGWGNNEKEYYTNSTQNVNVSSGYLNLTARYSSNYIGSGSDFTSGKIITKNKFDQTYGRFEASMKLPSGRGLWPAFWMLPTSNYYGGWPTSGEIDIMEYRGDQISSMGSTLHYGSAYPLNQHDGTTYTLPSGNFTDTFHEFALEWDADRMYFYVDGVLIKTETKSPNSLNPASNNTVTWPWDKSFYMILNLAVGGWYTGNPSTSEITAASTFPRTMLVDYVRVYDMTPSNTQVSYNSSLLSIPGKIEAEHYNEGCNGYSYSDNTIGNNGGKFRSDGVDIETTSDIGGGHNVGWTNANEWMKYNVDIRATGKYDFSVRVASINSGKSMHIEIDGVNVTGSIAIPNTGGWQTWQTVTVPNIDLTEGQRVMRVVFDTDGINLNFVNVVSQNQFPTVSITAPGNNAVFNNPASISLTATAGDADGSVSIVEFFEGTNLLGASPSTSSPYTFTWSNIPNGTYTIKARATDNLGFKTYSDPVSIEVTTIPLSAMDSQQDNSLLEVYPNPIGDYVVIKSSGAIQGAYKIYLTDLEGKTLKVVNNDNGTDASSESLLTTSDLSPGMYLLKVESSNKVVVKKIIKQ